MAFFIHGNIVKAALAALEDIFVKDRQSDDAVAEMLTQNPKWGARDRNQATCMVYGIVRHYVQYCYLAGLTQAETTADISALLNVYAGLNDLTLPEPYSQPVDKDVIDTRLAAVNENRALRLSIPEWLDTLGFAQLGDAWDTEMSAMDSEARFCLRINTIRTRKQDVLDALTTEKIPYTRIEGLPEAVVLSKKVNLKNNAISLNGWVEIQDVSSQRVAHVVDVKPGMRVLDACAGAGGKTLHLACLMQNSGQIIATDISPAKLNILQQRARRADVHIIHTFKINDTFIKNNLDAFDRILIDAPCSSLGTLRRKPDLKHTLTEKRLADIMDTQQKILNDYAVMLKQGGKLIYSTCSILNNENQQQIKKFMDKHPGFKLLSEENISPAQSGFDGFYWAVLEKVY
jgi:16S rRNA (cytosine967-C5)-methyltransferase